MHWIILGIIISYFLGSIPTAYLYGRFRGIDIRKFGSGNIGATNALRVFGKKVGISILLLDILKGVIPVIFVGDFILTKSSMLSGLALRFILGISCICGHNWTIFLKFKGGKGVATSLGVLIGLSFKVYGFAKILGIVILVWLVIFICSRIVSLASILAGIAFPIAALFFRFSALFVFFSFLAAFFIILRHRSNLVRLFQGKEPRLSFRRKTNQ